MNRIFKNSIYSILRVLLTAPIFFIITPFTLAKIGEEGLGIWALIVTISSYQIFVDMGLTSALLRYVAKERVLKNYKAISEYLATSLTVYLSLSAIALILIFLFKDFIVIKIFAINKEIDLAVKLMLISGFCAAINMISGLFKSIIDGVQRMDVSNILLVAQSVINAVGIFLFLEAGFGLVGLGINSIVSSLLILITNIYFSKKVFPEYKINFRLASKSRFKEMFSYSANIQLAGLVRFWIEPLNKVLISNFFSISFVYFYETALRFANQLQSFLTSAASPIFPASSEISEHSGLARIENLRMKSTKYILFLSTILCSIIIFIIPDFVKLWLGENMVIIGHSIQIFVIGTFFISLTLVPYIILNGLGYSKDTLIVQLHSGVSNILGILLFSYIFGFYGFCVGFTISFIYGFFLTNHYYQKRFKSISLYKSIIKKEYISFFLTLIGAEYVLYYIIPTNSYLNIILYSIIIGMFSVVLIWKLNIVNKDELKTLFGENSLISKLP